MKKKAIITCAVLAAMMPAAFAIPSVQAKVPSAYYQEAGYYNCYAEVCQIRDYINRGLYLEAIRDCEQTLAWHYLSSSDIDSLSAMKQQALDKYNEYLLYASNAIRSSQQAINAVKSYEGSYTVSYFGKQYNAYDKGSYYLVNSVTTRNANGIVKFRVYKSNGSITKIGEASDWSADSSEYIY